jgi:hypothetical protein
MKKQIIALFALAVAQMGLAQEETSATLYGYAKGEFAFDSRQVIAAREGNYIDLASPNVKGNNVANFNGWGVESRLGVKVAGPEFFGMKSEALIEAHFFGSSDASINTLALRHAYVKLSSDKVEWLVGQYWHPMFVTNVSPGTYNFNAGSPFQPFNRSPQIRFSTKGNARFTLAAITERDFTSVVYGGGNAAKSGLPAFHAQLQFGSDDKFVGGFGANVKFTRNAGANAKTAHGKTLAAFNVLAYAKAQFTENFAWKIYGNFGQNPSELLQLGSVAYYGGKDDLRNSTTLSLWTEFAGKFSDSFEWGVFGGYSQDFGFNENNFKANYVDVLGNLAVNSKYAGTATAGLIPGSTWRVSPRVGWKSGNTKLGVELDYTSTTYGNFDNKGKIKNLAKDATGDNLRVSLSLTQTF